MSKKIALVLSGGGSKGAFQAGALSFLAQDKDFEPGFVSGVSVGALNGSIIAQEGIREGIAILRRVWLQEIKGNKSIYKSSGKLGWIRALLGKNHLYDNSPLMKLITKYVMRPRLCRSEAAELRVGIVSLANGKYSSVPGWHSDIKKMILASTSIPIAFKPINVSSEHMACVDGGVRNVTPLKEAIVWGADIIYVIRCHHSGDMDEVNPKKLGSVISVATRTLDIVMNEVINNDIHACRRKNIMWNDSTTFGEDGCRLTPMGPVRHVDIRIIEPSPSDKMPSTLDFSPQTLEGLWKLGYWTAKEQI